MCIDLICTDQPFTFMETGVCSSLDPCSKHNIIHNTIVHSTININMPYQQKIWDYKSAKIYEIRADLLKV